MEQLKLHVPRNARPLHTLYLSFPLESSWCHGLRTSTERSRTVRRAGANPKALKRVLREAKRSKLVAQPEISREAAEAILKSQAARTDEKFPGIIHVSHQLALLRVFFCTQWCCQRWWITEATEVSVRRLQRIPPENVTQTRAWVGAKRTCCGRRSAHFERAQFFLDVAGCSDSPCIVNITSHQKICCLEKTNL